MENLIFEPKILKWAREISFGANLENLTTQLRKSWKEVSVDTIKRWESGETQPTFRDIKKLAEIYKRPLAVFFLAHSPEEKISLPDFRTIGSKDNFDISPKGLLAIRKARKIQETAVSLYEELGEKPIFKYPKYTLDQNPEHLANKIRSELSISANDQFKFKKYEDFFEYLRSKIEATGVITLKAVLHDTFPTEDYRAFSFADLKPYVILINNKDYEGAKNFSLAHEFAHILLRETGLCNNFKIFDDVDGHVNKVEIFCNKFAANFLVPEDDFLNHYLLRNINKISSDDLDSIVRKLAIDFKVSRVVILRRMLFFKLIEKSIYLDKVETWDKSLMPKRKAGGSFSLKTIVQKNGKSFSSLVIEAYSHNKISYSTVSDYLGLKRRYISGFRDVLNSYD
ncbi:MAG: XRE family transcriptional regulator [Patescibacteria group bacterium]